MEIRFDVVNRLATKSRKQKAEKLKSFKAESRNCESGNSKTLKS